MPNIKEKLGDIAEFLRKIVRAMRGQSAEDDVFSGLINVKDERERTRLSEYDVYGHSGMQLISKWYPEEMGYWAEIAKMEDVYFISLEGEQRREAILMTRAKAEIRMAETGVMQVPKVETRPAEAEKPKEQKKGILHR